ncbi:MAG: DUF58 domain-containing protein [Clostridiales bacterium]|nr:DUF58 domain-containing protein [Clostridiales bacterium]
MAEKIVDDNFLNRLERAALYVRKDMQGFFGGNHQTRFYGSTVEFADFREYMLGDDIRRIDWNLYSRFERYFLRLFVDERQMHIQTFLDCSASMRAVDSGKALYAMRAAAAIGYLSVLNMDRTSIRLVKGSVAEDLCGTITGKTSFFRGISKFDNLQFKGTSDLEKSIINCPSIGSNNGLTVIISDLLTDSNWKKAIDYLRFHRRQVLLIQVLSPADVDPFCSGRIRLVDCEADNPLDDRNFKMKITRAHLNAYREALNDFTSDIKRFCASRGVDFVSVVSDEPVEKLIFERLNKVGAIK